MGLLSKGPAVGLAECGNVRPWNEPAKAGHLGPAPGARARPRQLQYGGVDPVGTHENIACCNQAIRKGRRHVVRGLSQLNQPAVHVDGNRARFPAVGAELEHPFVKAHQQVQPVHVMKPGAVARGGNMIERPLCHATIFVELPRRLQNGRPTAVDRPLGAFGIPTVEVDCPTSGITGPR